MVKFLDSTVGLCCESLQSGCAAPGPVLSPFSWDALSWQGERGLGKGRVFLLSPPMGHELSGKRVRGECTK